MNYPVNLQTINDLQLFLPDTQQVKVVYERQRAENPETPFPFWAKTWPSAYELASFLKEETKWIERKSVLELGAGTALPSFTIAQLTSNILISDHAEEAVELMKKNISLRQLQNAKAVQLDWNDFPTEITADVLLLSDVNYASGEFDGLLKLINRFIESGATVLVSTPQRLNITPFAEALQSVIRHSILRVHQAENAEQVEIRILVLAATHERDFLKLAFD